MPTPNQIRERLEAVIRNTTNYRRLPSGPIRRLGVGQTSSQTVQFAAVDPADIAQIARSGIHILNQGAAQAARRLRVTKNANDPFGGSIQGAIDSITGASETTPYIIEVASPGTYEENVVLAPHIYLVALGASPAAAVTLTSSSGTTLTIPERNSGVQGVFVTSSSSSTSDAVVRVVPSTSSPNLGSFLVLVNIVPSDAATPLVTDPGISETVIGIFLGVNGGPNSLLAADIGGSGGGLALFTGSLNAQNGGTGVFVRPGASVSVFTAQLGGGTNPAPSPWVVDVDGGFFAASAGVRVFDAYNGVRVQNGGQAVLFDMQFLASPVNTSLEVDGTSFAILGPASFINSGASFYSNFNIAGGINYVSDGSFESGTVTGPDQRPANPKSGMRFYATDRPPGAQQLTFVPGTGWLDQTDTLVP